METTTIHHKAQGNSLTTHAHGFWDWCHARYWATYDVMAGTWADKYLRYYGVNGDPPEEAYYTEVYADDYVNPSGGCWRGLLYNFNRGVWEQRTYSCGSRNDPVATGWTVWESYGLSIFGNCPSLPSIQAQWVRKLDTAGNWLELLTTDVTNSILSGYCWESGIYTMTTPFGQPYYWKALTP